MGAFAGSMGLHAVIGAIARPGDAEFDARQVLGATARLAQEFTAARGVTIEHVSRDGEVDVIASSGTAAGSARRLAIVCDGMSIGSLVVHGAPMFGPATEERTKVLADVAGLALARAAHIMERSRPALEDARYRLISGVGVNLRNTLGAASGYMQLVQHDAALTDVQQEYVTRGRRAIRAGLELLNDLVDVSRADAGRLAVQHEPVDVTALVRGVVARRGGSCAIVLEAAAEMTVPSDARHVHQLLEVLVYNAVRYTPREQAVVVRVERRHARRADDPASWVCISVTDAGGGVADAHRVFEEVHRVESGAGNVRFRLAICRRIARLLGGDLTLAVEKGVGSTFTLWLPAPPSVPGAVPSEAAAVPAI